MSACILCGWKSPTAALQRLLPTCEEKFDNCAGEGETHLLPASQACKPHHVNPLVPSWYPSRSKNALLFHRAVWRLSCGYHLWDPRAEGGGLSERAYLLILSLPNQIQGAGTSCGSLAPPGNECCSQRGALDRQGRRSSQAVSLFSLDKDPIQDRSDFPNKTWLEKTMFPWKDLLLPAWCFLVAVAFQQKTLEESWPHIFVRYRFNHCFVPCHGLWSLARLKTEAEVVRFGSRRVAHWLGSQLKFSLPGSIGKVTACYGKVVQILNFPQC